MGFHADIRAAAVAFLTDYADEVGVKMQVYPARPKSINPPTGFVDAISEDLDHTTLLTARVPRAEIIVLFGTYDYADTAAQKDGFVDGLIDWAESRFHQAGTNTMCAIDATEDLPEFIPTWLPPDVQRTYYGTRLTLGGFKRGT